VPVNNVAHIVKLRKLPEDNVGTADVRPLRAGLQGILFALRGRGTGLRYYTRLLDGRTLFRNGDTLCNRPPWGRLVAVDLQEGSLLWSVPVGRNEDGVEGLTNMGPPLVTAGGLVFHAGTTELVMRAHDVDTGAVLATFDLPAGLHAGPVTYKLRPDARQLLVIAPGGHVGLGSKPGDSVIAYALPAPTGR
jgi:glucose dehydrogenase